MFAEQKLISLLEGIEGWLPIPDALFLQQCASDSSLCIVEIGAYRGRSTIALALGACSKTQKIPMVFSIEPHQEFNGEFGGRFGPDDRVAYYQNLLDSGMAKYAGLVNLPSSQAARSWEYEIDLLFIDGDHRYEQVKIDIDCWNPHVVSGGTIVFDDATLHQSGPYLVIKELLASKKFYEISAAGKLRAIVKR